jgi:hypothetical protein
MSSHATSERHPLFDGDGLGVGWMRGALDLLLRLTAASRPTTPQPACSPSSDSPASPRSETTASTPSPAYSNANSPRPTLDTNLTLPTTPRTLYPSPSGFLRARPLQILCRIRRQDVGDHDK